MKHICLQREMPALIFTKAGTWKKWYGKRGKMHYGKWPLSVHSLNYKDVGGRDTSNGSFLEMQKKGYFQGMSKE